VTHVRSDPCGSGVEVELAALGGRVTIVEAELVTARATRDQLAAEVERLRGTTSGFGPASMSSPSRSSSCGGRPGGRPPRSPKPWWCCTPDGRAASRAWPTAATHAARFPTPTRSAGSSTLAFPRPARTVAAPQRRAGGLPVSTRPPPLPATESCRYDIQIGRCQQCRRRVQPRHPEQTSQALGAAGVQVGPRAVALAAWASKAVGCVNVFMQLAATREPDRRVGPVDAVCLDDPWRPR
jgi:hypothetical protein